MLDLFGHGIQTGRPAIDGTSRDSPTEGNGIKEFKSECLPKKFTKPREVRRCVKVFVLVTPVGSFWKDEEYPGGNRDKRENLTAGGKK